MKAKLTSAPKFKDNASPDMGDIKVGSELTESTTPHAWYAVQAGYAEWIDPPTQAEQDILRSAPMPKYQLEQKAGTAPANTMPKASPGEGASGATPPTTVDQDRMDRTADSGRGKNR